LFRRDVQYDPVKVHDEPEQVEIQRAQFQVQNLAGPEAIPKQRQRQRLVDRTDDDSSCIPDGTGQRANGEHLPALSDESRDGEGPDEGSQRAREFDREDEPATACLGRGTGEPLRRDETTNDTTADQLECLSA
jgi:hypothetical protein